MPWLISKTLIFSGDPKPFRIPVLTPSHSPDCDWVQKSVELDSQTAGNHFQHDENETTSVKQNHFFWRPTRFHSWKGEPETQAYNK